MVSVWVSCDKHDTDQGRSELRRFVRMVTLGGPPVLCEAPPLSPAPASAVGSVSNEVPPAMTSVDVNWDMFAPSGKQVAIESDGTSEVSESRVAESDSKQKKTCIHKNNSSNTQL